jgi:hypothetical protein
MMINKENLERELRALDDSDLIEITLPPWVGISLWDIVGPDESLWERSATVWIPRAKNDELPPV